MFVSAPPSNPPTTNAVLAPIAVPAVKERAWFKDGVVAQVSLVGSNCGRQCRSSKAHSRLCATNRIAVSFVLSMTKRCEAPACSLTP